MFCSENPLNINESISKPVSLSNSICRYSSAVQNMKVLFHMGFLSWPSVWYLLNPDVITVLLFFINLVTWAVLPAAVIVRHTCKQFPCCSLMKQEIRHGLFCSFLPDLHDWYLYLIFLPGLFASLFLCVCVSCKGPSAEKCH